MHSKPTKNNPNDAHQLFCLLAELAHLIMKCSLLNANSLCSEIYFAINTATPVSVGRCLY